MSIKNLRSARLIIGGMTEEVSTQLFCCNGNSDFYYDPTTKK